MPRNVALGPSWSTGRVLGAIACLVVVMTMAVAFWSGVLWIGELLVRIAVGY
jgi:hypothetical protein